MEIKDVENLAELAKIELSEEEKKQVLSDMDGILGYVKQIELVEVPDIQPEYEHRNIWREDDILTVEFSREEIISQFPDSQDGFVKVKKIL
jgi:aspartyl-tRNA(Asn)/glutamyl-tRNA(Gln) amidotransferase subunit C